MIKFLVSNNALVKEAGHLAVAVASPAVTLGFSRCHESCLTHTCSLCVFSSLQKGFHPGYTTDLTAPLVSSFASHLSALLTAKNDKPSFQRI